MPSAWGLHRVNQKLLLLRPSRLPPVIDHVRSVLSDDLVQQRKDTLPQWEEVGRSYGTRHYVDVHAIVWLLVPDLLSGLSFGMASLTSSTPTADSLLRDDAEALLYSVMSASMFSSH